MTPAPGTLRGPFRSSEGNPLAWQYVVRTQNGWVPFMATTRQEAERDARQGALALFTSTRNPP